MKGHRDVCKPQTKLLKDYEMQRQQQLKKNVELMAAKGKGSLTSHIYDKSQEFLNSYTTMSLWDDGELFSDEENNDGEHVVPENDGFEDEICFVQTRSKTKYTIEDLPQKQHRKAAYKSSGSMAAVTKQTSEQLVGNLPVDKHLQPRKHSADSIRKQQPKAFNSVVNMNVNLHPLLKIECQHEC